MVKKKQMSKRKANKVKKVLIGKGKMKNGKAFGRRASRGLKKVLRG